MKRKFRYLFARLFVAVLPRPMATYALWSIGLPPIAGAEDPPGGSGGGDGGNGNGGNGGGAGDGGGAGSGDGSGSGSGGSGDGGGGNAGGSGSGGGDGWTPPTKAEWDNFQRQQRETRDALEKIQRDQAEAQRKADEEAGNHQAIAERERQAREKAERERDEARQERINLERSQRVTRIAGRLKFRDPADVQHHLSDDVLDDDSKVEKALKDVAKSKPYLVIDGERQRQGDVTGGDGGDGGGGTSSQVSGTGRLARAYGSNGS